MKNTDITIESVAKQIREAYVAYGESMRRGELVFPPSEKGIQEGLSELVAEAEKKGREETVKQMKTIFTAYDIPFVDKQAIAHELLDHNGEICECGENIDDYIDDED